MGALSYIAGVFTLVAGLSAPLPAAAIGVSFGGRLIAPPIKCVNAPGSFLITIKPAGLKNVSYVYTPGFSLGLRPPTHPGQQILGIADAPIPCNGVVNAQRIQLFGVSII